MLLTVTPKNSEGLYFTPGQYVSLRFKRFGRPTPARCFSIVNAPNNRHELQFAIRVRGKYTAALNNLALNSEINVDGPFGDFVYDPQYDKHSVLIAGGIGITPIMSIILDVLEEGYSNKITLLYSVRREKDAIFKNELVDLAARYPNFKALILISSETASGNGVINGRINNQLIEDAAASDFENTSFFICGPARFMTDMKRFLETKNTPQIRINTEAFTQAQAARDNGGWLSTGLAPASIYTLVAIAFVITLSAVMLTDISANTANSSATNATSTNSTDQSPASSNESDYSGSNIDQSTNSTNQSDNSYQTYQQPVSSVS